MMFADDRSIENLQQLFVEFKKYLKLQKEYTKLEITEKLSILLSALVLLSVVIILGMVALFYLSFALAYILDPLVGGLMVSFSIIAAFHLLLVLLVITFRKKLIISPMVNFLAGLFHDSGKYRATKKRITEEIACTERNHDGYGKRTVCPPCTRCRQGQRHYARFQYGHGCLRRTNARSKDDEKGKKHVRSQKINRRHKAKKAAFFH